MSVPGVPPSAAPGLALDLGDAHGGLYVSTHFVAAFWGISCMQLFTYYVNYPKDLIAFKVLVAVLWSMLTIQVVCVIEPEYTTLVKYWGNPAALLMNEKESSWQALLTALTAMVTQSFFTYRLYMFSNKRKLFPIIFIPAILGQLVAESVDFYYAYHAPTIEQFLDNSFRTPAILSNAFPVAIDTGLAACMTYWLVKESRGTQGSSHDMVVRLVTLTINSGFWTASVALAALVTSIVSEVQTYGAVYYILCALYCNTVLANLNARGYIRGSQRSEVGSSMRFETQHIGRSATSVNLGGITSQAHEDSHPSTIIQEDKMKAHFGQSEEV